MKRTLHPAPPHIPVAAETKLEKPEEIEEPPSEDIAEPPAQVTQVPELEPEPEPVPPPPVKKDPPKPAPPPKPTKEKFVSSPKPVIPREKPFPPLPGSTLVVPLNVSLGDVINILQLEAKTPRGENFSDFWGPFPNPDSPQAIKYEWERKNFDLATQANEVQFTTPFKFYFEYAQKRNRPYPPFTCCIWDILSSCGKKDDKSISNLILKTEFSLGSDWRMISKSSVLTDKPKGCPNSEINQPLIERIQWRLKKPMEEFAKSLDAKSAQFVNLKPFAKTAWDMLIQPIQYDADHNVWMTLNPSKVKVTPIDLDATTAYLSIGIESQPKLTIGHKPKVKKSPLPDILLGTPDSKFQLMMPGILTYNEASEILTKRLPEEEHRFSKKRKIKINKIRVYGNSIKLIVRMDLEGDFKGRLYFSGKPQYDEKTMILSVPDLDYDLKTRDWLTNTAPWLLSNRFIKKVRGAAQWELAEEMKRAKETLTQMVSKQFPNKERFVGEIKNIQYKGVRSAKGSFVIYSVAEGELKFFLE